jgi:hypothetical protein
MAAACDTCGNTYHNPFTVTRDGTTLTFDSLECAAQKIAPTCGHCGCRILGHGVEPERGRIFCCEHCAEAA